MFQKIKLVALSVIAVLCGSVVYADNQTATVSPILPSTTLPFQVAVEQANFSLPNGIHSGAFATYKDQWLFIAGRTNGLHGFGPGDNNFPPQQQNVVVYVVDPRVPVVYAKSLYDPTAGLNQTQIDSLSVTSPQSYQSGKTLYMTGGYGVNTATGLFDTKNLLTAIDVRGLMHWVTNASPGETAAQYIRQISNDVFQVTGGYMTSTFGNETLLIFGQNFTGFYTDSANGNYIQQVQRFKIHDNGKNLSVTVKDPYPALPDPNYRRRDLNVVPIMQGFYGMPYPSFVAFSGVFTETSGAWTVPVLIDPKGVPSMNDPNNPSTFKQGMNNYVCPTVGLYSKRTRDMYTILFGGISFGYFQSGGFVTDSELPFINQITTIQLNKHGNYFQYLMSNQYPVIPSTGSNPGNPLLFGAGAYYIPVENLPAFDNDVLMLDKLGPDPLLIGYIVGGIMSTLPNTNVNSDSAASPYIFRVILTPQ